jgi:hypothetical protein
LAVSFPTLRSRRSIAIALFLLLAAVVFLPYLVPVAPSVSLSYLVGYSNRTGFLIFSVGSVLFALLCRNFFPEATSADEPLGLSALIIALAIAVAACCFRLFPHGKHLVGVEASYALSRIQMLVQRLRPYRDFEFAYGPAHLYIPVVLARMTHRTALFGYYAWWMLQWILGTAMLWAAIRLLELPLSRRRAVFWILFVIQLPAIVAEGTAYTPTRTIGSAFFVVLVAWLLHRKRTSLLVPVTAILCVGGALAISPEQGIAVFSGLLVWFILLNATGPNATGVNATRVEKLSIYATALFFLGAVALLFWCWRFDEFSSLLIFSKGAYSFPLLPSPTNITILVCYIAAACAAAHTLLAKRFDSVTVPLFFTGFALLPAAMGRCDVGHLLMAAPALLLGIAAIEARPTLRVWWSPLAILLVGIPAVFPLFLWLAGYQRLTQEVGFAPAVLAPLPCTVIYRTVNIAPNVSKTPAQDCLDTGRYDRTKDAFTPQTVDILIAHLDQHPLHPILLMDLPLAEQLKPADRPLNILRILEVSPWLPQPRNPPFTYQKLQHYIEGNYLPSPTPISGFRVWYPKPAALR